MLLCLKTLSSPAAVQTACRPDRLFSWPADRQSLPVAPPTSPSVVLTSIQFTLGTSRPPDL